MFNYFILLVALLVCCPNAVTGQEPSQNAKDSGGPLSESESLAIKVRYEKILATTPRPTPGDAGATGSYSVRGDAFFFLSRFKEAADEYEMMVALDPELDTSHWRLGIAYFYADKPQRAVRQFEKYRSFDDVDRENGIWRYLSQFKATDGTAAKKELIRYAKDDRQPFPAVYKLFDDSVTPEQALSSIPMDIPAADREARLFYTELYIGMHMVVKNSPALAKSYLKKSVERKWPRTAGYGPNYMWHVGRVQLELLNKASQK